MIVASVYCNKDLCLLSVYTVTSFAVHILQFIINFIYHLFYYTGISISPYIMYLFVEFRDPFFRTIVLRNFHLIQPFCSF